MSSKLPSKQELSNADGLRHVTLPAVLMHGFQGKCMDSQESENYRAAHSDMGHSPPQPLARPVTQLPARCKEDGKPRKAHRHLVSSNISTRMLPELFCWLYCYT